MKTLNLNCNMLKRLFSVTLNQTRALKSAAKVTWVRPEHPPAYKPEKSGDLEANHEIPTTAIAFDYQLSQELETAPDEVKRLFSVGFVGGPEKKILARKELLSRVMRHKYDSTSAEARIALLTGRIRNLQQHLEKYPRDTISKVTTQELIDKRKMLLKYMRTWDYKRFEWLIEKLNLEYKGFPQCYNKLTRKESLRKLTEMYCEDVRNNKLQEYRNLLESQQGPYLEDKLQALKTIRSEQEDLRLEVTVSKKDIAEVEKLLETWQVKQDILKKSEKKRKSKNVD